MIGLLPCFVDVTTDVSQERKQGKDGVAMQQ